MGNYLKFRPATKSEITVEIKGVDNAVPDLFHGKCPKDNEAMIDVLEVIINHCKANIDNF